MKSVKLSVCNNIGKTKLPTAKKTKKLFMKSRCTIGIFYPIKEFFRNKILPKNSETRISSCWANDEMANKLCLYFF